MPPWTPCCYISYSFIYLFIAVIVILQFELLLLNAGVFFVSKVVHSLQPPPCCYPLQSRLWAAQATGHSCSILLRPTALLLLRLRVLQLFHLRTLNNGYCTLCRCLAVLAVFLIHNGVLSNLIIFLLVLSVLRLTRSSCSPCTIASRAFKDLKKNNSLHQFLCL